MKVGAESCSYFLTECEQPQISDTLVLKILILLLNPLRSFQSQILHFEHFFDKLGLSRIEGQLLSVLCFPSNDTTG